MNKTETDLILGVLNEFHASDTIKAINLLKAFGEIFVDRCRFAVVGQLATIGNEKIEPSDPRALKVCLGWYSTQGEADKAAAGLWRDGRGGLDETWRTWAIPVQHASPTEWFNSRKQDLIAQEIKAKEKRAEKARADMERRRQAADEIARKEREKEQADVY